MRNTKFSFIHIIGALGLVSLLACKPAFDFSDDDNENATFSLNITDAPIDSATEVIIEFTGVEIKGDSGAAISIDFNEAKKINLLDYQGDNSASLVNAIDIAAGSYQWIRLKVNAESNTMDSYITFENGSSYSLYIPSGNQTGLKLNNGFSVLNNQAISFTVDFDLRKSIVNPPGQENDYFLKPTLRIINSAQASEISGTVSESIMLEDNCLNGGVAVYVYENSNVPPDDEGSNTLPVTSAAVTLNPTSGHYEFIAGFLEAGDYTAALTCDAELDDPETNDDISFIDSINVTTVSNQTSEIAF